jgi:hypothetical protein
MRWLCGLSFHLILAGTAVHASAEISDQQALDSANKEIVKFHVNPPHWDMHIDKTLQDWRITRDSWENWVNTVAKGRAADTYARIAEIEAAIKGKEVWLVVYKKLVPPGVRVFHTHAVVFLDATSGEVLAIINPEE